MKAFITGMITLILLIFAVTINSVLITDRANRMLRRINELPISVEESETYALTREWEGCQGLISASVSRKKIDEINDTIRQLNVYIRTKNTFSYLACREHLLCLFEHLLETESLSFGRIF